MVKGPAPTVQKFSCRGEYFNTANEGDLIFMFLSKKLIFPFVD